MWEKQKNKHNSVFAFQQESKHNSSCRCERNIIAVTKQLSCSFRLSWIMLLKTGRRKRQIRKCNGQQKKKGGENFVNFCFVFQVCAFFGEKIKMFIYLTINQCSDYFCCNKYKQTNEIVISHQKLDNVAGKYN